MLLSPEKERAACIWKSFRDLGEDDTRMRQLLLAEQICLAFCDKERNPPVP